VTSLAERSLLLMEGLMGGSTRLWVREDEGRSS
jgi:hypothetical protein